MIAPSSVVFDTMHGHRENSNRAMPFVIVACAFILAMAAIRSASNQPAPAPASKPIPSGWDGASGNIWGGTELYLNDSKAFIGVVTGMEVRHRFPDGSTREGVSILFNDGELRWLPRDAVKALYSVKLGQVQALKK